ncbi:MAG: nucleotidyl transferase AbiEii/AbiGii toxin family protein [Bacteroidetes bacterium]|nr:nucleotidyl transferase AbiEii/AbiGii toxin family protein [Bacteroidota bacterium]
MTKATSIRAKLYNISKRENLTYQGIIFRYIHERLLFRLSKSSYSGLFCLKGGNLMYALDGLASRPTNDLDFSFIASDFDESYIKAAFAEICRIPWEEDKVWFDAGSIATQQIAGHRQHGIRLLIDAGFDTIIQRLQIDVGFGDILAPSAVTIVFPVLLSHLESPILLAYRAETVVAEKFQAMILLSSANSRMKDFYDVFILLKKDSIDKEKLQEAIKATFINRQTPYAENQLLFEPNYSENKQRQTMWKAFLRKTGLNQEITFDEVVAAITSELKPYWENLKPET